ncbi:restriction endonuclease [Mesoterricola sediminis]|uniref:Restriction endonuclease type IV Mrr domain-containing protein n=1 Tax=Mesoterricola sediminis TaxID=2927980 RepID=A0AA48KE77_9BACT|nr:restriction endonuclease [Mesoterricola sediminis]BDU77795.1 hypothetical protein METESE_27530 [Mesoterricola sediminis]
MNSLKKKRPGKSLEELVATLERVLGSKGNVTIESPAYIRDRITGDLREHDVLILLKANHHCVEIAIECRDRSRKITVNDVESFWAKCRDTGIARGVIVSPKGFTKAAMAKAAHHNIRCLRLSEVDSFPWLLASGLRLFNRIVHHFDWKFIPKTRPIPILSKFTILDANREPIDLKGLERAAMVEFQGLPVPVDDNGNGVVSIHFPSVDLLIRDDEVGRIHEIESAVVDIQFETVEGFAEFKKMSYEDSGSDKNITDAAIADVDANGMRGQLVIVYKEDQGGKIVFVPINNKDA